MHNEQQTVDDGYDSEEVEAIAAALDLTPDELNEIEYTYTRSSTTTASFTHTAYRSKKAPGSTFLTSLRRCPGGAT
ncbi:hypothetical protein DAA51_38625 [Bradyrhizobium sp. WBAH10]|nr:hypothetical protein [Bradyrhizobium sp. WBAH30]MDD1547669.1 hypothetical protein [Bradyrhizobium sp. WBAH41]MDD1561321.1 hypothetical protein [Bradyrhizobium sp. WBAH23]MDD1568770.1 hypothetical protein [Bradyrhizobium sp. WBAH33]MDD1594527.1 hypothetical protein [Bradyrhizobium sp. WBAH42]NRB92259.1 hypothetical protein [Bradyrhizobium sp. WBAH10]QCJ93644.1 hypothetical protein DAA57_38735 [Bradyrhizobium yuanmingense]